MGQKVNLTKVANDLGISVSQVSRALSGKGRVSDDTRQRIQEYLLEHDLEINSHIKKYSDIKTNRIGIVLPGERELFGQYYYQGLLELLYDFFSQRDYAVVIIKVYENDYTDLKNHIVKHSVDGVIFTKASSKETELQYLIDQEVPFVVIGNTRRTDILQVKPDLETGAYEFVNSLLRSGLTKLSIMCPDNHSIKHSDIYKGIMRAHVENYMLLDPNLIFYSIDSTPTADRALAKCKELGTQCILCLDDVVCDKIIRCLHRNKVHIPHEIKIASFRSSRQLANHIPAVSCLFYNPDEIAEKAGELLYRALMEDVDSCTVSIGYVIQMKESTSIF